MNENQEILSEIFSLIEEQARSLQWRLSPEMATRCQERSDRIRELLEEMRQNGVSEPLRVQY
jgi:hypothetical protein